MGKKKLNRDLALKVLDVVGAVKDALDDLLETCFIIYQPKDCEVAIDEIANFTVKAMNVASYQWQGSTDNGASWYNLAVPGSRTATVSITVAASTYAKLYHCHLVGNDGTELDTVSVKVTEPQVEIEGG